MKKTHYIYSILTILFLSLSQPAEAVLMTGDGQKLQTELFNTFTKERIRAQGEHSQADNNANVTSDPITTNNSYNKKSPANTSLTLNINPQILDFGLITAGEPIQRQIKVNAKADTPYQLLISQTGAPSSGEHSIPPTTCDSGDCTPHLASKWTNPLVFGFGYSCKSNIPCKGFENSEDFRPISDITEGMSPTTFISTQNATSTNTQLTFKVNIPPSSSGLEYNNNIKIYALPSY